jgi:hypothetical protein
MLARSIGAEDSRPQGTRGGAGVLGPSLVSACTLQRLLALLCFSVLYFGGPVTPSFFRTTQK